MKKIAYFAGLLVLFFIFYYSFDGQDNHQTYRRQVAGIRAERVRFLKSSQQSPFVQFDKKYQPVSYFDIAPDYKVRANLERISTPTRLSVQNSDGTSTTYSKFAYARFKLHDQSLRLLILKPTGFGALPNTYLTAFADETSGTTTYGGGRYLDLEIGKSDNIAIDFNLAYNPYCAYVMEYSCPLPPVENILPIKIEAGEKAFPH